MNVTQNEVKSMTPASNQAVQRQYAKQSGIAVGEAFAEAMIKASEGLCNRAQLKRILEQPPEAIKNSLDAVIHTFKTHINEIKPEGVTAAELKPVDKSYYHVLSNLKSQCSTVLKAGIAGHTEKLINATSWQEIVGVARELMRTSFGTFLQCAATVRQGATRQSSLLDPRNLAQTAKLASEFSLSVAFTKLIQLRGKASAKCMRNGQSRRHGSRT